MSSNRDIDILALLESSDEDDDSGNDNNNNNSHIHKNNGVPFGEMTSCDDVMEAAKAKFVGKQEQNTSFAAVANAAATAASRSGTTTSSSGSRSRNSGLSFGSSTSDGRTTKRGRQPHQRTRTTATSTNANNISGLSGFTNSGGIGIEDILRETDECDNVEDVVNNLLHQAQAQVAQNTTSYSSYTHPINDDDEVALLFEDDEMFRIESNVMDSQQQQLQSNPNDDNESSSVSSTEDFLKQHRNFRETFEKSRLETNSKSSSAFSNSVNNRAEASDAHNGLQRHNNNGDDKNKQERIKTTPKQQLSSTDKKGTMIDDDSSSDSSNVYGDDSSESDGDGSITLSMGSSGMPFHAEVNLEDDDDDDESMSKSSTTDSSSYNRPTASKTAQSSAAQRHGSSVSVGNPSATSPVPSWRQRSQGSSNGRIMPSGGTSSRSTGGARMPKTSESGSVGVVSQFSAPMSTHNPQEWAMLQAILNEKDDDDDDDDDADSGKNEHQLQMNLKYYGSKKKGGSKRKNGDAATVSDTQIDIDRILQSMDDDDDDEDEHHEFNFQTMINNVNVDDYHSDNDDDSSSDDNMVIDYYSAEAKNDTTKKDIASSRQVPPLISKRPKPISIRDSTFTSVNAVADESNYYHDDEEEDEPGRIGSSKFYDKKPTTTKTRELNGGTSVEPYGAMVGTTNGNHHGGGAYFYNGAITSADVNNHTLSDSITIAAMTQAQFREGRLLRGFNDVGSNNGERDNGNKEQQQKGEDHHHGLEASASNDDMQEALTLVSPLSVKRRMKPNLELLTKSRRKHQQQENEYKMNGSKKIGTQQQQHQTQDSEQRQQQEQQASRYDFAGILDVIPMEEMSKQMTRSAATLANNLPTALAVSEKFICIGTQSGLVYVYDMFQQLRQTLSSPANSSTGNSVTSGISSRGVTSSVTVSVTSMDISANDDTLLAGYTNGLIILWDPITGKALKQCSDAHPQNPITSVRYVMHFTNTDQGGKDTNATSQGATATTATVTEGTYACISVDASGLVNKLVFTKSLVSNLWGGGGYSVDVECLLDGTAGQILALEILPPITLLPKPLRQIYEDKHHFMQRVVLIGLSSSKSSFVVAVQPNIQVLHRWARHLPPPPSPVASTTTSSDKNKEDTTGDEEKEETPTTATTEEQQRQAQLKLQEQQQKEHYLPCLAWGWSLVSGGGNVVHPILARAWGKTLQMLRASYIEPLNNNSNADGNNEVNDDGGEAAGRRQQQQQSSTSNNDDIHQQLQWPAFGVLSDDEFETDHPVMSLEWINERSLAYLTEASEFTVIDTVCMTMLERVSFVSYKLVYAEMKLSGTPRGVMSTTFGNSIRGCLSDRRLYVACQHSLLRINLQSMKTMILEKEANGEWLQALALALDYYENYVKVLEDRIRFRDQFDKRGRDLRYHPEFYRGVSAGGSTSGIMTAGSEAAATDEWLTGLLLRYLRLAVENAPRSKKASSSSRRLLDNGSGASTRVVDLTLSHYTMLAGVCVEYCIHTRRLQVLYQKIYPVFRQIGFDHIFFDVMQPYILKDSLTYVSPEVMAAFVQYCKRQSNIEHVERCLLHLDVTIMDFDSILPLLRDNEMYSALLHVFTLGLDDYVTPLELLLEGVMDAADFLGPDGLKRSRRLDGVFQNRFERFGYKALLFLQHCFNGNTFPSGSTKIEPPERIQTIRPELLKFLLQPTYNPSSTVTRRRRRTEGGPSATTSSSAADTILVGRRADPYPYISILVMVDAKALLDAFSIVLDAPDVMYDEGDDETNFGTQTQQEEYYNFSTEAEWANYETTKKKHPTSARMGDNDKSNTMMVCPDRQQMVSILASIIRPTTTMDSTSLSTATGTTTTRLLLSSEQGFADVVGTRQASAAKNAFLTFLAKYLDRQVIRVPKSLTHAVLKRMSTSISLISGSSTTTTTTMSTSSSFVTTHRGGAGGNDHEQKIRFKGEEQIMSLLEALPPYSYDLCTVLPLMEQTHLTRVALLLHKKGAESIFDLFSSTTNGTNEINHNRSEDDEETTTTATTTTKLLLDKCVEHFYRCIEYYVRDTGTSQRGFYPKSEVFEYVKSFCDRADMIPKIQQQQQQQQQQQSPSRSNQTDSNQRNSILLDASKHVRRALMNQMGDLVKLDPVLSAQLVAELFADQLQDVMDTLQRYPDVGGGRVTFDFLHVVISGELKKMDSVAGPVLESCFTKRHHYQYVKLMCEHHPEIVYNYLLRDDSHHHIRLDECLKLCQSRHIADASAYLLERTGNVSGALQLLLQTLESRLMNLKRVIRSVIPTPSKSGTFNGSSFSRYYSSSYRGTSSTAHSSMPQQHQKEDSAATLRKENEIQKVRHIVVVALDLCERTSKKSKQNSGNNQEITSGVGETKTIPNGGGGAAAASSQLWFDVMDRLVNAQGFLRLVKEQPHHTMVMSEVLGNMLQLLMQRMVSNVPLKDLLKKLTMDYSGHPLGEFRQMVTSLLQTYSGDLHIASSALDCTQNDMNQMSTKQGVLKCQGMGVNSIWGHSLGGGVGKKGGGATSPIDWNNILLSSKNATAVLVVKPEGDGDLQEVPLYGFFGGRQRPSPPSQQLSLNASTNHASVQYRLRRRRKQQQQHSKGGHFLSLSAVKRTQPVELSSSSSRRIPGMLSEAEHFGRL